MNNLPNEQVVLSDHAIEALKINQDRIIQMANNAQLTKALFLTLSAAAIAFLSVRPQSPSLMLESGFMLITLVLWLMDAKYLQLEQQFKAHHKAIVNGTMNYSSQWDFNPKKYKVASMLRLMFSGVTIIYPVALVLLAIVTVTNYFSIR